MFERWILSEAGEWVWQVFPRLIHRASAQCIANTVSSSRDPDKLDAVGEELEAGSQHSGRECFQGSCHQGLQGTVVHDAMD